MKKLFFLFMLIAIGAVTVSQNAFAITHGGDDSLQSKAAIAIHRDFPAAQKIVWKHVGNEFVAFFNSAHAKVVARYNKKGKLLCTITNTDAEYIPASIQSKLTEKYPDYAPQYMKKFTKKERNNYYILLKSQSSKVVNWLMVKSDGNGKFTVIRKLHQSA